VRMGVHSGEASETSTGLVGFDVHRAARVGSVAHGGQIVFSETAAVLARGVLPAGASLRNLGLHRLKDLGHPQQLFQLDVDGLASEFPALRSLDSPELPNNLPAQAAAFVGRVSELAHVRALVESSRLVTLTGAGGAGKTRLSLQAAAELLDGSGDGVWLVELASISDEESVPAAIAEALRITGRPVVRSLEVLLDALARQSVLIVLDNCEHLIAACAKFAEAVLRRCPKVHLLATSREPLGIGAETIFRVPSLSLPSAQDTESVEASDAVAFFVERMRAQGVALTLGSDTTSLVASICQRLDGMPLAIELAAARLRSMSLADLSQRLDQRFRLLTGGSRNAAPRQQTLQAAVQWSYSLLSDVERSLLRRVSVFVDGFDLETAETVCSLGDLDPFEITDLIGSLADKSLVVAEPTASTVRYRLLETIRQFAAERLVEGDGEAAAVADAHCQRFLQLAETAGVELTSPAPARGLDRLDANQANLRRAFDYAAAGPDMTEIVMQFAIALRRYWWWRRADVVGLLVPVLERPAAEHHPRLLVGALVTAARVSIVSDIDAAQRLAERALAIARPLDDDQSLIGALWATCGALSFAGEFERGLAFGTECVERARLLGDDVLLGEALSILHLASQGVAVSDSEVIFSEAIACLDRSGDLFMRAVLLNNAGGQALRMGNIHAARERLEEASELMGRIGLALYHVKINLAFLVREEDAGAAALPLLQDALRMNRRTGDYFGLAYATLGLACLAGDAADWERAARLHGAAQTLLERIGQPWLLGYDRFRQTSIDTISARLGQKEFRRSYTKGCELDFDEAMALAHRTVPAGAKAFP
jgi:predicted ATPase